MNWMRLTINLVVDVDDTQPIDAMRTAILDDVMSWLASPHITAQLAGVEDALTPAKAQFAAYKEVERDQQN